MQKLILPSVVSGCEIESLILREQGQRIFGNRMLRKIFGGCNREEVIGGLRKSHIEELHDW